MDFNLTEDQLAFREAARTFAEKSMAPHAAKWDDEHIFPVDVLKEAGEMGFMGIYTPEALGGMGLSRLDTSVIVEELAAACPSTAAFITIHNMATWMVASFASDDLKQEVVPKLASGEQLASYCLTEPGAGSDAANLRTKAVRDGDSYVINGSKVFISGAGDTDILVLMARTGAADSGAKGISTFVIPADAEGVSYGKNEEKMGWHSQPTRTINLENVRVPATSRVGEEGDGFAIAMKGLDGGRLNIATCSLGGAQAALLRARNYMHEREQFGKPLAAFQALQFKLADMATNLVAARQMVRLGAFKLDSGDTEATLHCAMAKRFATDACFDVVNDALQLHGGYGYIREYPLERFLRDLRVHQILEGTNEIMRLIVARRVLDNGVAEAIQ
ncbi:MULTISPECIES: acyl-CoA dehydrogenase family protein [unclassified Marinobacter]|uniref:acyl-CoA dehydrogenase family protein n=1 Tax=unclassified Marinobacter TaxID=83889 RepID=UPI0026E48B73|nr:MULTISPECIES: acyl-CoA dehydrogenase family protein [unclassified Marinobacter]MDO6441012.1 acyl-CoA dehydrogenase family protein [Marinobacter sp. 2_MG-2023]MDO6823848.1 acyl-CoA dehydrogenase family protein [Marinobacter sp. 1_MG-2023]